MLSRRPLSGYFSSGHMRDQDLDTHHSLLLQSRDLVPELCRAILLSKGGHGENLVWRHYIGESRLSFRQACPQLGLTRRDY